jgi:hypothetical protein
MTEQVQTVRKFYKRDKVARAVIENLAGRPSEGETDVGAIAEATRVLRLDVVRVLKELEKRGCGEFVVGRKGRSSRMKWSVDPRLLLGAATDELDELPAFEPDPDLDLEPTRKAGASPIGGGATNGDFLTHIYNLRPGLTVSFELPGSLTRSEADRLAKFILSLPFD